MSKAEDIPPCREDNEEENQYSLDSDALFSPSKDELDEIVESLQHQTLWEVFDTGEPKLICQTCFTPYKEHVVFLMHCAPRDIDVDDFSLSCSHGEGYASYWEGDTCVVSKISNNERWVCCDCRISIDTVGPCGSSVHYKWFCKPAQERNPCDEEFMKAISS